MRTLSWLIENAGEVFPSTPEGPIPGGVVGGEGAIIAYVGPPEGLAQAGLAVGTATRRLDAGGGLVTPGWVEAHTHLIFAGDRADEYARRTSGESYLDIAAAGGGIASTVRATRAASLETLVDLARPRLDRLLAFGVTTAEAKSGYGLDLDTELKLLRAAAVLGQSHPVELVSTFLGAHTVPPEHRAQRSNYLKLILEEMLPAVAQEGLARFCDVFVERGAFSLEEARAVLLAGQRLGLASKLHADQLSAGGGAELAAELGAVSADHLERISLAGIEALARRGVVAVLLPGASLFLGEDVRPPARALLDAGVPVALSTDLNPGTCMTENLQLMLTLGMSRLRMSPREVLEAVTVRAAQAIGCEARAGTLQVGRPADVAVFNVPDHLHLPYHFGVSHTRLVMKGGQVVFTA